MNKLIDGKKLGIIVFLTFITLFALSNMASAGVVTGNWDFQCSRHGFNDYKNCGGENVFFPNNNTYFSVATSFEFLGHRHGGSMIGTSVCLYFGSGVEQQGECHAYRCSGNICGNEYGGEHPWDSLSGDSRGTLSFTGSSKYGRLYYSAEVKDAEVRNIGSWTAYYADNVPGCTDPNATNYNPDATVDDGSCVLPPAPSPGMVNLNFFVKDQNTQPISGALVTINQDFGNGTTRNTDGNGFANFGVNTNTPIGYAVSATNCSSVSGTQNIGSNNVTVNITLNCGGSPLPGTFNLTVNKSGSGVVTGPGISCGADCSENFDQNTSVDLRATPNSGWTFSGWSGDCGSTANSTLSCGMNSNKNVTATFASADVPPPTGCQGNCAEYRSQSVPSSMTAGQSTSVSVTMKNIGTTTWTSGGGYKLGSQNPQDNFTWGRARIDVPTTISPGQETTFSFNVTAPSTPGTYNFQWRMVQEGVQWFGDFTPNMAVNVTSTPVQTCQETNATNFGGALPCTYPTYTLSVSKSGSGSGTVTGPGISCGGTCSSSYSNNTSVTLNASSASGSEFKGWSGDVTCVGTGSCTFTMNGNKNVTAVFDRKNDPTVNLFVSKSGTGSGTVTGGNGINCGSSCLAVFNSGNMVSLDATPSADSVLAGWSSPCSGTGGCVFQINSDQSVVATFNLISDTTCQDPNATNFGGPLPCTSPGFGTISVTAKEVDTGSPINTSWTLSYNNSTVNQDSGSSKTYSGKPAGQYNLEVLQEGTTHIFDHFDITPSNQVLSSDGTLSYVVWYRPKGQPPSSPPPSGTATNSCTVNIAPPTVTISSSPSSVTLGRSANLTWSSYSAGSCSASGDWSGSKNTGGSQSTGSLSQVKRYAYTITCYGSGQPASATAYVDVTASPPTVSNIVVTEPNYCVSGPAATVGWTYSDPVGSPQSAYQVQITDTGSFNNPILDTGKINSGSNAYFTGQGVLQFNTTYRARTRVWNSFGVVSGWSSTSNSWKTPSYAYPQVDFNWTANEILNNPSPPLDKPVQFTDATVFNGNPNGREWSWVFGDGGTSTVQNPSHTYNTEGSYYVTLTATDNADQVCTRSKGPLIIQKPIPKWREVAPR